VKLDWVQVEMTAFARAREVAAIVGDVEATSLGRLAMIWRWALELTPDGEFPTGEVRGEAAVVRLEAAAGWSGARGELVSALVGVGLIEMLEDGHGLRVKGLNRYASSVTKRVRDRARAKALREALATSQRVAATSQRRRNESRGKKEKEKKRSSDDDLSAGAVDDVAQVEAFALATPEPAGPTPEDLRRTWNQHRAPEQPEWRETSPKRAAAARARLTERPLYGAPDSWEAVVQRIARSSFARGRVPGSNGRTWVADPEWLLRPDSAARTLEGRYDDRAAPATPKANDPFARMGPLDDRREIMPWEQPR